MPPPLEPPPFAAPALLGAETAGAEGAKSWSQALQEGRGWQTAGNVVRCDLGSWFWPRLNLLGVLNGFDTSARQATG